MNRSTLLLFGVISLVVALPAYGATHDRTKDKRVAVLIERMLRAETEQKAFSELEALGCTAVPSMIRRMNDRRKLAEPIVTLPNRPRYAFRETQHYGAIEVADALAIILNQLTGQNFWSQKGATDEERTRMIRGWRNYLESTPSALLCDSPQLSDYMLDGGLGEIALYQAEGYLSYVPSEFVVHSLEELEQRVGQLPPGTRLHWSPYKRDASDKPILLSDGQYVLFEKFCRDHKIELLVPSSNGRKL